MILVADLIAEFHEWLGRPFGSGSQDIALRQKLQLEEALELDEALASGDRVAIAHELADVVYVAYGTAHDLGIPLDPVIAEVHRANLAKLDPNADPVTRPDGKLAKPPGWRPPDVASVLARHGALRSTP